MDYRALLLVGVVVLAGCSSAPTSPAASPTDSSTGTSTTAPASTSLGTTSPTTGAPPETPTRGTPDTPTPRTTDDSYYNAFEFRAERVSLAEIGYDLARHFGELDSRARRLAEEGSVDGMVTTTVNCEHVDPNCGPLEDGQLLRDEKTFYRVSATVQSSTERTGYRFEIHGELSEYDDGYETATQEAIDYDSLSRAQRAVFERLFTHDGDVEGIAGERLYVPPEDRAANASGWLDGDVHYVRYGGKLFRLQHTGGTEPRVRVQIHYQLRTITDSGKAFARQKLDEIVVNVTADQPPQPAREVILAALEDGVYEWDGTVSTRPASVEAAADWLREYDPGRVLAYDSAATYVRYQGDIYRIRVREAIE